eukprot:gene8955-10501_t
MPTMTEQTTRMLYYLVKSVEELRSGGVDLNSMIVSRYLSDMFASLLQLLNASPKNALDTETRSTCGSMIDGLLYGVHPELVFESLTMLMGDAASPVWLRRCVGIMLSRCLMRPHALHIVLATVLAPQAGRDPTTSMNGIVRLVAAAPSIIPIAEYYNKMAPQIREVLHSKDRANGRLIEAAVLIVDRMLLANPALATIHIIGPIIAPLMVAHDATNSTKSDKVIIKESDLFFCIEDLHKLVTRLSMCQPLLASLSPVIPTLFRLHCFVARSISSLKVSLKEIISTYFKFYTHSVTELKRLILPAASAEPEANQSLMELEDEPVETTLTFGMGEDGGVVARYVAVGTRDFAWETECLVGILQLMKNDKLAGDLFIDLLNEYASIERVEVTKREATRYFVLMQFLVVVSESLGASAIKNVLQVATLIDVMLSRSIDKAATGNETEEDVESTTVALGILATLLTGEIKVRKEEEILVFNLLTHLEHLMSHPNDMVSVMATQLKTVITAKKPIWLDESQDVSGGNGTSSADQSSRLKVVLEDLSHPLLPVRAHGLIELRRLVLESKRNDPTTIVQRNLDNIIDIFKTQINDDDTFIYTCAIHGLTALGDIYPRDIIPLLTEQFTNPTLKEDRRMKLGESLVQISQRCGEALPHYAQSLFNCFFMGCRDASVGVRASSLSNIATMCELLKFAIDAYLVETIECITSILRGEREVEVRRGAIYVFQLLLKGLGLDAFSSIPTSLSSIYTTLKYVESSDTDPVCKYHARSALSELETITKQFLFPNSD